jgi:hypothetical protein
MAFSGLQVSTLVIKKGWTTAAVKNIPRSLSKPIAGRLTLYPELND